MIYFYYRFSLLVKNILMGTAPENSSPEPTQAPTPQAPPPKKSSSNMLIFFVGLGVIVLCCIFTAIALFLASIDWSEVDDIKDIVSNVTDTTSDTTDTLDDYLGYEVVTVEVETYEDMNDTMFSFYENLQEWAQIDSNMYDAVLIEDPDALFDQYALFNEKAGELMGQAEAMAAFMEDPDNQASSSLFQFELIQKVYALKRTSFWYWVPILGSIAKSSHELIETSRSGLYQYIGDLPEVDRQDVLDNYNLNSIEDLRNASDEQVSLMARDPILKKGIYYAEIKDNLDQIPVINVIGGIETPTTGNIPDPVEEPYDNAVTDIKDGKIDTIDDVPKVPEKIDPTPRITLGISENFQKAIDAVTGGGIDAVKDWGKISSDKKDKIIDAVVDLQKSGPPTVVYKPGDMEDKNAIQTPPGNWDFVATTQNTVPVEINNVPTASEKVTEFIKATYNIVDIIKGQRVSEELTSKSTATQTDEAPDTSWWDDSYPSCPFIYVYKDGTWKVDNDLISVARTTLKHTQEERENLQYTDYLKLNTTPDEVDGEYRFKIKEIRDEVSYIDSLEVWAVDAADGVSVSTDFNGNVWGFRKGDLKAPRNASDELKNWDRVSKSVYHGDVLEYDFSNVSPNNDSVLVLNLDGFSGENTAPTFKRPKLTFQTKDDSGNWVERGFVYPREFYSDYALNTSGWFKNGYTVRVLVDSCFTQKYHLLDFIGIDVDGAGEKTTITPLKSYYPLNSTGESDVAGKLSETDNNYLVMPNNSWLNVSASAPSQSSSNRSFVIVTSGYYVAEK